MREPVRSEPAAPQARGEPHRAGDGHGQHVQREPFEHQDQPGSQRSPEGPRTTTQRSADQACVVGLRSGMLACMSSPLDQITSNPEQCGGRACIRGMRIRVIDILDLLAAGLDAGQILVELPDLEAEDIKAALL